MVVGKLLEAKEYSYGYDAQIGEYGDLVALGIIDPTKVVRTALQDAASMPALGCRRDGDAAPLFEQGTNDERQRFLLLT